jgi:porin
MVASTKTERTSMNLKRGCVVAALMACATAAHAGAPQPFPEEIGLDWNDLRDLLRDQGIDFRIGYVSESATNVRGGTEQLWRYTDQWTFATKLDLQKLFGLSHAQFNFVITDRNGKNLSSDARLDSLQQVQELYGRGQTWRWTEFFYDQTYLNGKIDWKVGRTPSGDDFGAFSCEFVNLTFCGSQPGNVVGSYWYNWPVSQWATRVKVNINGFGYVQLGALEVNPSYLQTRYALDFGSPPGAAGVLAPLEIGWLPTIGGLGGSYKFGGWYSSTSAPDVVENTARQPLAIAGGEPLMRHGQYGAYINFQQRLTAPAGVTSQRGVSVFLNGTYADHRTSGLDSQIALGMLYTGPSSARAADELGFALGETHVNPRIGDLETLENDDGRTPVAVQGTEYVGEVFYKVRCASWLDLRPSIQYVVQPGGIVHNASDLIAGLRVSANF